MAKRLFQQSLSDHCVGRSLSFEKVVAYSPRGSLSHKRICLLYSVVKELWRKQIAFMCNNNNGAGKRGGKTNHTPYLVAYSSGVSKSVASKSISKSKIIFMTASLIRPFNSISTAI